MQHKDKKKNWIAIIALGVSILSLGYTIISSQIQSQRLEDTDFINQSLQNRPVLSIIGNPEVKRVEYEIKAEMLNGKVINSSATKLKIDTKIRIRNDGNTNAHLIFYAVTDRLSGLPEMRNITISKFKNFPGKLDIGLIKDYYQTIDILPGKEHIIQTSRPVQNINEGLFNIHYYLVYKNEVGNVYDTYYWARFRSKEFKLNPSADSDSIEKALMDSIVFVDDHYSYKVFSREESRYLINLRETIEKSSNK